MGLLSHRIVTNFLTQQWSSGAHTEKEGNIEIKSLFTAQFKETIFFWQIEDLEWGFVSPRWIRFNNDAELNI